MLRTLLQTGQVDVDGCVYVVHYFESKTARGLRRFSGEVVLDARDRIILDDDSLASLEARVARLAPETIYSRALRRGRGRRWLRPERPRVQKAGLHGPCLRVAPAQAG